LQRCQLVCIKQFFLFLVVCVDDHSDKQIQQNDGRNDQKDGEIASVEYVSVGLSRQINLIRIDAFPHHVDPAFGGDHGE